MIVKQPSVYAVALIAPCSFCADRGAAESVSSNADLSRIDTEDLRLGVIPQPDLISLAAKNRDELEARNQLGNNLKG